MTTPDDPGGGPGQEPDEDQVYERLEHAVRRTTAELGMPGVLTDWVAIVAVQDYDADGEGVTTVASLATGRTPYYRLMGLLDFAHTHMRQGVGQDEEP